MAAKETFYIKKGIKEELHFILTKESYKLRGKNKINFPFLKSWRQLI